MALWFDVDDLVRYFCLCARPTGIQRLSLAMFRELQGRAAGGEKIYFCRRQPGAPFFRGIDFPALDQSLRCLIETPAPALPPPPVRRRPAWLKNLPPRRRQSLGRIAKALRDIAVAARELVSMASPDRFLISPSHFDADGPRVTLAPGDWLINLGSSWNQPYGAACLDDLRAGGVRLGVLVYDMIPEKFPEWTARETLGEFRAWVREVLPRADMLFAISRNTAIDVEHCLSALQAVVPPVAVLPIGAGKPAAPLHAGPPPRLPYVLLVSTLEVRKNHALMFRVWQRLLERYPAPQVPDLVFAGKPGWLTTDFLSQLENTGWLNGKIKWWDSPSDAELAMLYRHCLFTVYPSFYEGWGLPVSESLGFGKTVAVSNRASMPDAGGNFCVYFDPENLDQVTEVIGDLIRHPEQVARLERHIARHYNPPDWPDTIDAMLNAVAAFDAPAVSGIPVPVIHQAA